MPKICKICGKYNCQEHEFFIGKTRYIREFSGSSPPEVFVGRWNYPNVYAGILSPDEYGDTKILSSPELWHKNKASISQIMEFRNKLIYGRSQSHVKKQQTKFFDIFKEVAMTHKSIATGFKLKKPIKMEKHPDLYVPLISKSAPIERVRLEENPQVERKVDYLVNDTDVRAATAIQELEKANIETSGIIKILSAGLLGLKKNRKLVPTRWAISSVDSLLSENKIKGIKNFPLINEYLVFNDEFLGNHYEILLVPRFWSFEVIEISLKNFGIWKDYESIFKRKKYAEEVAGGYYSPRLAVTEYLERIKRQASVLVLREIRPEYYAPLGVGVLRETTRSAMRKLPRKFETLQEALSDIATRLKIPINRYLSKGQLLGSLKQTTISQFM